MSARTRGVRFSLAVLVAGALAVLGDEASARGSRRQAAGYEAVDLATIRGNPLAFKDKRVAFECFFAGLGHIYQPFQTPFVSDQFLNFCVWEPDTRLWGNEERKRAFLFCYVPRDLDEQASYIMSRQMYDSVRLYGRVVVVYVGQPWFEIEDVEPSDIKSYTDLGLKHILVGIKSLRTEDFSMARESFERARDTGLPSPAEVFVQRELGGTYYELKKYTKAYDSFERAGTMDAWLALRKGQSLSRAADEERDVKRKKQMLTRALDFLKTARELEPANPESHAEIGWVRAKRGNPGDGIRDCKRANALMQGGSTYRILGKIYDRLRKPAEAENNYQRAIMLDPSNPSYHQELADLYKKQAKLVEAEAEYKNVITLTKARPDGYRLRADVRKRLGNTEGAIEDYESALRQDSEDVDAILGLAVIYRDRTPRDYKSARRWIGQAKQLAPDDIRVLSASAELLRAQGALEDTIAEYRRIIKEHPKADLTPAYFGLGEALYKKAEPGHLAVSAKMLGKAVALDPDHARALKVLAEVYAEWGKYREAVKHLRVAKELEPGDERNRLMYADALAEDNQVEGAMRELSILVNERPESAYAKNNYAYLLAEFGRKTDLPVAKELAQDAREKDSANPLFQDTLGWVKYKLGDEDDGRLLIEQAIIKSKQPDPFYHLAVIAYNAGEVEFAKENTIEARRRIAAISGKGHVTRRLEAHINELADKIPGANVRLEFEGR